MVEYKMPIRYADGTETTIHIACSDETHNTFYHEFDQWMQTIVPVRLLPIQLLKEIDAARVNKRGVATATGVSALGKYAASVKIRPGDLVYDESPFGSYEDTKVSEPAQCWHEWRVDTFFSAQKYETCKKCGAKKEEL